MDHNNDSDYDFKVPVEIEIYERKIYDLKQLIEISKGLNSTLEYNILIDSILLTCMGHMQLIRAGIFLKKGIDHEVFVFHRNYKGFDLDHTIEYELEPDSEVIKLLENTTQCYTLEELIAVIGSDSSLDTMKIIDPTLVVPLKGKGKLNGIILLGDRINGEDFKEWEKEYLLNIASLAGIAIQNAYLYEMATTDMMTKLKIHHFFQAALVEERERAGRQGTPLSLIMMDIDHFKNFNDEYGHTCGDLVLVKVARIIQESVRQLDIPARYGGEEFAIILPNTELGEALMVAKRIRQSVEEAVVVCSDKNLSVTISIGVTQYDYNRDIDNKTLVERADKALYISKAEGRNRVSLLE
ncbi:MAG TPA: diguanylate cyclase DgcA [Spirochaetota bacterium]|nr:diguanylate cyclase DgcA [Spirochaetota bacterium]HPJ37212.1 diguanylate cyclase DgcA [Spirochaetota bacterium]HPQ52012.1 diguanylate cyclase DgcA [Spirochaetota bacterium]